MNLQVVNFRRCECGAYERRPDGIWGPGKGRREARSSQRQRWQEGFLSSRRCCWVLRCKTTRGLPQPCRKQSRATVLSMMGRKELLSSHQRIFVSRGSIALDPAKACGIDTRCEWLCSLPSVSCCRQSFRSTNSHLPSFSRQSFFLPVHAVPAPVCQLLSSTTPFCPRLRLLPVVVLLLLFKALTSKIKNVFLLLCVFVFLRCYLCVKYHRPVIVSTK